MIYLLVLVVSLVDLHTNISQLSIENPLILASGIMDEDAGSMKRILQNGAAAVVTKSIGIKPRLGHHNPTCISLDCGILNAMGLPNPGIIEYQKEIEETKKSNKPIFGSIFGSNVREFELLAKKMQAYGTSAVELNLSCPHAEGYGLEIGQDSSLIETITSAVKRTVNIPVFVKLSSNVNTISSCATAAAKGGADAIVAINTVKAMSINIEARRPVLGNKKGGYSGRAIKPIGIRAVFDIYEHINIPIIGCGGITTGRDAIEYLMAGATALQIGSAIYYRGINAFNKILTEITQWMNQNQYHQIKELIGVAHQ